METVSTFWFEDNGQWPSMNDSQINADSLKDGIVA